MAYKNPYPTVHIIIETEGGVVLIKRKNPPYGWAIPGGFVDWMESMESAARREAKEETCLDIKLYEQFHTYSDPSRDPRFHTISTVYLASATGIPKGADDAVEAKIFTEADLPAEMAFDHRRVLKDYFEYKKTGKRAF